MRRFCFGICCHCIVDHSDLWTVTVRDDDFISRFDQIGDCLGSFLNSQILFRKILSEGITAKCNDDTFFTHD